MYYFHVLNNILSDSWNLTSLILLDSLFCSACFQTQFRGIQQCFAFLNQYSTLDFVALTHKLYLFQM